MGAELETKAFFGLLLTTLNIAVLGFVEGFWQGKKGFKGLKGLYIAISNTKQTTFYD